MPKDKELGPIVVIKRERETKETVTIAHAAL